MKPEDTLTEIKKIISPETELKDALTKFIDFYDSTKVAKCSKSKQDDMLLFQYSEPWDLSPHYTITLTRQFTLKNFLGSYKGMLQLSMTVKFAPGELQHTSDNKWYENEGVEKFKNYIFNTDVVKDASKLQHQGIEFYLDKV